MHFAEDERGRDFWNDTEDFAEGQALDTKACVGGHA